MARPNLISDAVARLRRLGERLGWPVGALYLCHRALRAMTGGWADIHCYFLVQQPVGKSCLLPGHLRDAVAVRTLTGADPEIATALSRAGELDERLRRGDTCLAAFQDGRLAGYLWLCYAPFEDDETGCRFAPLAAAGGAWDFDLSVAPESRGGIAFAALWDAAWGELRRQGYGWTASRVSAFNDRSLRAHRRLGAVTTGTILVLRAGRGGAVLSSVGPRFRLAGRHGAPATVVVRPRPQRAER